MTTRAMDRDAVRRAIVDVVVAIAPDADFEALDPHENMREALDIDSFDFLNILIGLQRAVGVEVPEADYGQLISLEDLVAYVLARRPAA